MDWRWGGLVISGINLQSSVASYSNSLMWPVQQALVPDRWSFVPLDSCHVTRAGIKSWQSQTPWHSPLADPRREIWPCTLGLCKPLGKQQSKGLWGACRVSGKQEMGEKWGCVTVILGNYPKIENQRGSKRMGGLCHMALHSSISVFPKLAFGFRGNWGSAGLITSSKGKWQVSLSLINFPSLAKEWVDRHHL